MVAIASEMQKLIAVIYETCRNCTNAPSVKFLINVNFEFLSQVFSAKCYTSLERAIYGLSNKL